MNDYETYSQIMENIKQNTYTLFDPVFDSSLSPCLTEVAGAVVGVFMEPFSEPVDFVCGLGVLIEFLEMIWKQCDLMSFSEIRGYIFVYLKCHKKN